MNEDTSHVPSGDEDEEQTFTKKRPWGTSKNIKYYSKQASSVACRKVRVAVRARSEAAMVQLILVYSICNTYLLHVCLQFRFLIHA